MEYIMSFLSSIAERVVEGAIIRFFSKPHNIKARLSTIEAYCVYYPIYLSRVIHKISSVGSSKPFVDTNVKERFRRSADLLYLPEPYYNDLVIDVKDSIANIFKMFNEDKEEFVRDALKYVEEMFKKKYSEGDIQIPNTEEVIEETLILIYAVLKFKETVDPSMDRPLAEYYSALILERSLEEAPLIIATIISAFTSPEAASQILQKLRGHIPSLLAEELNCISTEIEFSYEDFKNAFIEIERKLRR